MKILKHLYLALALAAFTGCDPEAKIEDCAYSPTNGGQRVTFVLRPTDASFIRCEMFLPDDWDGRFWGYGNGGWAGKTWFQRRGRAATMTCDLGTSRRNRSVVGECREVLADYGWRATHLATLAAKEVIRHRYGRMPERSYFHGESCGGRQGLTEAIRFPEDYDGIICEVPGLPERSRMGLAWRREQLKRKFGKWFTAEERAGVREAELAVFAKTDPEWAHHICIADPTPTPEKLDACWREIVARQPQLADREALWRALFEPVTVDGKVVAPGRPLGVEFDSVWSFLPSKYLGIASPADFTEADFARMLSMADDWSVGEPDFTAFRKRGGKIIMYAGLEDLSCPEPEIRAFYEAAAARCGGIAATSEFFVYYVEPGRTHGAMGEEAGYGRFGRPRDLMGKIVDWVENGKAPGELVFDWLGTRNGLRVRPYPENSASLVRNSEGWVWLVSRLKSEEELVKATNLVDRAARSGFTAVVLDGMEDAPSSPERADRLVRLNAFARSRSVELIPSLWNMGRGGTITYANPDTVETTPVKGLRYRVGGRTAHFVPETVETGHEGRVITNSVLFALDGKVRPWRTYEISFRVRTEGVEPCKYYSVRGNLYHGEPWKQETELNDCIVKPTQDWKEYVWRFNTYATDRLGISIGINRSLKVSGTCWFDSVELKECPLDGCLTTSPDMKPVVRLAKSGRVLVEGKDYAPFPKMRSVRGDKPIEITLLPGGALADGDELLVDAHVPAVEGGRQYSVCPSSPDLRDYWKRSAASLDALIHPKRWFFTVDEWRVANRCARCLVRKTDPGRLMGECVAEMAAVVREVNPKAEVCAWADMFCPLENAGRKPYYCVNGDMRDSWKHVPRNLIMVPWMNGRDVVKTTNWLMEHGFRCVAGGYYNRPDLKLDETWRDGCKGNPLFLGMMFTTWGGVWGDGGYYKLEEYGKMLRKGE